ncbi:universal stress protein [Halobacterium jilantaiense]|uniref:Nucleotide-binding universal stress protein, UspA family n=1 Tax=Halobacterium jilantaiense TaxID=355548 RepID=A0A1I0NFQ4_9EURY|nr:universal stress protein [Halobacterium jilantaiense]SEV99604.1 Nucleotide-binding universal stress protein, UspA family [Halobacterium jilantaiense]
MSQGEVLVPLDGSPLADEALREALALFDAPVTVLNVVTPLDSGMSEGGVLQRDEQREAAAMERADSLVARASDRAASQGRTVETVVETGEPAETILAYVEANDVDHVVMGGHGGPDAGLAERLLGTVATKVVTESPTSVTVVR